MGLETNFTITGQNFRIKNQFGEYFADGGLALVQWEAGYDPKYHPLQEWTSNPILVSWTAWYQADFNNTGRSQFGSNGTLVNVNSPLYLFIDFGNSSNATPTSYGQVWMGQITDSLVLDGTSQVIDLNTANLQSVVGSRVGNTLMATDWNTWTPTAVPEPSYAWSAVLMFFGVVAYKLTKKAK